MQPQVLFVHSSSTHSMEKTNRPEIDLIAGLGVSGDAHAGTTVKHRSRVAKDPTQPNLRQVHLIHSELLLELKSKGFSLKPGKMGENITTIGLDLLALPTKTKLKFGDQAVIEVTGLRNPCAQLDGIAPGLMSAVLDRNDAGELIRKAGIMGVVLASGTIRPGDRIEIEFPPAPHFALKPV